MGQDVLDAVDKAHLGHFSHRSAEAGVISCDPFGKVGETFIGMSVGRFRYLPRCLGKCRFGARQKGLRVLWAIKKAAEATYQTCNTFFANSKIAFNKQ